MAGHLAWLAVLFYVVVVVFVGCIVHMLNKCPKTFKQSSLLLDIRFR